LLGKNGVKVPLEEVFIAPDEVSEGNRAAKGG
jgi:hypothetical protein